jgi:ADP-heptose:LPS heptosyltransferase
MKRLILRLSSLGDLILSQSVLEPPYAGETHWVVAKEFENLLAGNPKIQKLWTFDRRASGGMAGWIRLLSELRREDYSEVLDIHSTVRTQIARLYFRMFSPRTRWLKISKERFKRIGYEMLKRFWPASLRPQHFSKRCALLAGGYGNERPSLRWHLKAPGLSTAQSAPSSRIRIALVPASAWKGKEWPTEHYLKWVESHLATHEGEEFVLLGTTKDLSAVALRDALLRSGVKFEDTLGKYSLREISQVLAGCSLVVGADTGLLHLAEAVNTPVVTLFGPTRADFGFGPLDPRSQPVHSGLWCAPCSKDGSLCFRAFDRYACLKKIEGRVVESAVRKVISSSGARQRVEKE